MDKAIAIKILKLIGQPVGAYDNVIRAATTTQEEK